MGLALGSFEVCDCRSLVVWCVVGVVGGWWRGCGVVGVLPLVNTSHSASDCVVARSPTTTLVVLLLVVVVLWKMLHILSVW